MWYMQNMKHLFVCIWRVFFSVVLCILYALFLRIYLPIDKFKPSRCSCAFVSFSSSARRFARPRSGLFLHITVAKYTKTFRAHKHIRLHWSASSSSSVLQLCSMMPSNYFERANEQYPTVMIFYFCCSNIRSHWTVCMVRICVIPTISE